MLRTSTLIATMVMSLTTGCGEKQDPGGLCGKNDGTAVYTNDVEDLLNKYCSTCHAASRSGDDRHDAPVGANFDTYGGASSWSEQIAARVESGAMPPQGALPTEPRCRVIHWHEDGATED